MKTVLVLDTETTGLDRQADRVIELGAALYSVEHKNILQQVSTVLPCQTNPAQGVNQIPVALSQILDIAHSPVKGVLDHLEDLSYFADAIVAHNAPFDRAFTQKYLKSDALWVDSMDLPFPNRTSPSESLINLALAHGIGVLEAHRAMPDVLRLCNLLGTLPDLSGSLTWASRPKGYFASQEAYPGAESKRLGFRWNPKDSPWDTNHPGCWLKWCFYEDVPLLPFRCREVTPS